MAGTEKENDLIKSDAEDHQTDTVEEEISSVRENENAGTDYIEASKDEETDDMHSSGEWRKQGLVQQSIGMLKVQEEVVESENGIKFVNHEAIQLGNEDISEDTKSCEDTKKFFAREWKAFKDEMETKLSDRKEINTVLNFGEIRKEWKSEGNEKHWSIQAIKKEGETCSTLFSTIIIGILFTLIPNCAIVLDYMTAKEYIVGNYYIKYETDPHSLDCRNTSSGQTECFEYDPIYGGLTLSLTFISGFFWSFGIFLQLGTYLRKDQPEVFQRKRMLFLFFLPLALISMISFPLQLFVVSLISCFNDQDQWILLTTKIGIAEGMFNAHFQYMLQLFIIFTRADRHPSLFQYLSAFGSLIFLAYSRIESLLLDRGGHHMSPGQKAWWICRFGPCFLFNCAFKVGSISLIIAMLRFNSIWFYGTIIITWFLLQILFNEQCLPSKYYYLFIGAGLHAISVAHIPQEVKLIDTKPDSKNNILWTTRLSSRQLRFNLLFQNFVWFIINSIIIITLTIVNYLKPETEISTFWPFISKTYSFKENKVFRVLYIIAPILLLVGLISQVLLWRFEFKKKDKQEVRQAILMHKKDATDGLRQLSAESDCDPSMGADIVFDGWRHVPENCPGCENGTCWHRHVSDDVLEAGVQGRLSQVIYPLMNIWQNVVDKNTA